MPGLYSLPPFTPASKATRKLHAQQDPHILSNYPSKRPPFVQVSSTLRPKKAQTCSQPIRPKKVTDPLTETAKARIYGAAVDSQTAVPNYVSSGSDHDPSSACLAALVHEFMEDETDHVGSCGHARCNCVSGNCSDESCRKDKDDEDQINIGEQFLEILEGVTSCTSTTELLLLAEVAKAIDAIKEKDGQCVRRRDGPNCTSGCLCRFVMSRLRYAGYNAAICKSRWHNTGGLPAGNYEYIDVMVELKDGKHDRFILDMDFKAQFEIARATNEYNAYMNVLPTIFLGRPERLQQLLKIMSEATKRSLKRQGLHLPPWRRLSYMQAKWFSSYKRTTNEVSHEPMTLEETLQTEMSSVALKGSQFCSKFANKLQTFYEEIESRKVQEATRRIRGDSIQLNFCRSSVTADERREIKAISSEWQLPVMRPEGEKRRNMVSGIAGALKVCKLDEGKENHILGLS